MWTFIVRDYVAQLGEHLCCMVTNTTPTLLYVLMNKLIMTWSLPSKHVHSLVTSKHFSSMTEVSLPWVGDDVVLIAYLLP